MNRDYGKPAVVEIIGYSGAGKTTLIEQLIPFFRKHGLRIAVVKHTGHCHEFDKPGKDSHRLRLAGAEAVFVSSPSMVAMFRDIQEEWPIARILNYLPLHVDLVLAEGFRHPGYPAIEVFRHAVSPEPMYADHPNVLAVVGDDPGTIGVPRFHQDAISAIGQFIIDNIGRFSPRTATGVAKRSFR